ncbi:MAG: beta-phosphoglucomutase [Bacteroidota bacterium]
MEKEQTAFIFDLDGVIVDTAKYHFLAWKKLADELGIPFTKEDNEQFKGVSRRRCLEILLEMGNVKVPDEQFNTWLEEKNKDYLAYIDTMDKDEVLPDVPKVLQYLKGRNIRMALGSASKNARPILEKVSLLSYFGVIVDGTEVFKAKPDPEVFLKASEKMGAKPKNCVVFEDALAGIDAANTAGMTSIGIGNPEILSKARYNFTDFTEIELDFLDTLTHNNTD